jgi:phosphohistidine phosphatase
MELYFLRHGIAGDRNDPAYLNDQDRPLTDEGIRKTREAAQGLKRLDVAFDKILTSPWLRARQTAEIVAEALGMETRLENLPELEGDRTVDELLTALGDHRASRLLLVGHEPLLGDTVASLVCPDGNMQVGLKKSGAAAVEIDSLPPREPGRLLWLVTAKQLRLLGK